MNTDVVIVGGGPAGTAAALTLRRYSPLNVVLLERSNFTEKRIGETIGPGVAPMLKFLGVEDHFAADGHSAGHANAAAWGSSNILTHEFFFTGRGHGWHLDRNRFDRMLCNGAVEAGAIVMTQVSVRDVARKDKGEWCVRIQRDDTEEFVTARFLIDASGRSAVVARQLGGKVETLDQLAGVMGFVEFDSSWQPPHHTFVETSPEGWWYCACLPRNQLGVAFLSDADLVRRFDAQHLEGWLRLLSRTHHMRNRVVGGLRPRQLVIRSAASQILRPAGGENWLAAGDAASAFDPLSSMGIGHALSSGAHAARVAQDVINGSWTLHAEYLDAVEDNFLRFVEAWRHRYAGERRWAGEPFWARRQVNKPATIYSTKAGAL